MIELTNWFRIGCLMNSTTFISYDLTHRLKFVKYTPVLVGGGWVIIDILMPTE